MITILLGASLNISNWNFSIKDGGIFSNEGELILQNTETQVIEGLVNDINSGTVRIDGTSTATSLKTGSQYYNLTIGGTGNIMAQPAALIVPSESIVWLMLNAIFASVIPVYFAYHSLQLIGSDKFSVISTIELPMTLVMAFLLLNERLTPIQLIGMSLVVGSIILLRLLEMRIQRTSALL